MRDAGTPGTDPGTPGYVEAGTFGSDLGSVRIHSTESSQSPEAQAIAHVHDIHMNQGTVNLVGHELTHVVPQRKGR